MLAFSARPRTYICLPVIGRKKALCLQLKNWTLSSFTYDNPRAFTLPLSSSEISGTPNTVYDCWKVEDLSLALVFLRVLMICLKITILGFYGKGHHYSRFHYFPSHFVLNIEQKNKSIISSLAFFVVATTRMTESCCFDAGQQAGVAGRLDLDRMVLGQVLKWH